MSATVEQVNTYIGNCMVCDWMTEEFDSYVEAEERVIEHNAEVHEINA